MLILKYTHQQPHGSIVHMDNARATNPKSCGILKTVRIQSGKHTTFQWFPGEPAEYCRILETSDTANAAKKVHTKWGYHLRYGNHRYEHAATFGQFTIYFMGFWENIARAKARSLLYMIDRHENCRKAFHLRFQKPGQRSKMGTAVLTQTPVLILKGWDTPSTGQLFHRRKSDKIIAAGSAQPPLAKRFTLERTQRILQQIADEDPTRIVFNGLNFNPEQNAWDPYIHPEDINHE